MRGKWLKAQTTAKVICLRDADIYENIKNEWNLRPFKSFEVFKKDTKIWKFWLVLTFWRTLSSVTKHTTILKIRFFKFFYLFHDLNDESLIRFWCFYIFPTLSDILLWRWFAPSTIFALSTLSCFLRLRATMGESLPK